jgi:hemolysin activation/secretion protein
LLPAASALAQIPNALPSTILPGRDRPPPPLPPESDFEFSIQSPGRAPQPRSVDEIKFVLRDIKIEGAHAFPPEAFAPLIAPLRDHEVTLADINGVADAIEAKYRAAGFAITRAFVPPQRVSNGIFTISVVEGFIANVSVEGADPAQRAQTEAYLAPVLAAKPLDLATLERAMLLTNDLPGIAASGLLRPSPNTPGASDLAVSLAQTPLAGDVEIDNRGSNFAGPWILHSDIAANSLLGTGEQFYGSAAIAFPNAEQKVDALLRYRRPVGADGWSVSGIASGSYGEPGGTLAPFAIVTNSYAVGPRVDYPIIRGREQSLLFDSGFTVQSAEVAVPGQNLSHDNWRVLDASLTYLQNGFLDGNSSATLTFAQGLPIFGATPNGSPELSRPGAHTTFTKLVATVHWAQAVAGPVNMAITVVGQYTFTPLVAGEQIAFGGDTIGRGYDPDVLLGDRGFGGSLELRYDRRFEDSPVLLVEPYAFYEGGKVANVNGQGLSAGSALSSAGAGVRATLIHGVTSDLEYAKTLTRLTTNSNGNLTSRVLFSAAVQF